MATQVLYNSKGKPVSVLVPYKEYERMQKNDRKLKQGAELLHELVEGLRAVEMARNGQQSIRPVEELLSEL